MFLFLKEIPPDLVYDIDRNCANAFFKFLLEKQKWPEVLLLLTRKVSGQPPLGDCLIKDFDLSNLDLCAILPHLRTWDQRRTLLLDRLIDHGGESQMLSQHRGPARGAQVLQVTALSLDFGDSFLFLKNVFIFWPCCGAFPDQGSNPHPLQWEHGALTPGPPGKSLGFSSCLILFLLHIFSLEAVIRSRHFCEFFSSLCVLCEKHQVCGGASALVQPQWSFPPDLWLDHSWRLIRCVGPCQTRRCSFLIRDWVLWCLFFKKRPDNGWVETSTAFISTVALGWMCVWSVQKACWIQFYLKLIWKHQPPLPMPPPLQNPFLRPLRTGFHVLIYKMGVTIVPLSQGCFEYSVCSWMQDLGRVPWLHGFPSALQFKGNDLQRE